MSAIPNLEDLSFDAVLPSAILLNDNLEPNAIKLYAFIRGLTRAHGYCFATNEYLATCMRCDESSVSRLIRSLKKEGFLEVVTNKEGIHWQRRIYMGLNFKKCLRRCKNEDPPTQICQPPYSKMRTYKGYKKEDIKREEEASPPAVPIFQFKRVKMDQSKMDSLIVEFGKEKIMQMMERLDEYADINPKRFKEYACHAAVIRKWTREDHEKKGASPKANFNTNQSWADQVKNRFLNNASIYVGAQGISFVGGQSQIDIKYTDNGFREQVLGRLRKMGLNVEGL